MTITGTFDARDTWFANWSFGLLPFPLPSGSMTTSVPLATSEAPVGSTWSLDTTGLGPCGYVLRLGVSDRAIVNSVTTGGPSTSTSASASSSRPPGHGGHHLDRTVRVGAPGADGGWSYAQDVTRFPVRFTGANKAMVVLGATRRPTSTSPTASCRCGSRSGSERPCRSSIRAVALDGYQRVWGWGAHGWRGEWLINGSSSGVVRVELDPPGRARLMGLPVQLRVFVSRSLIPRA